MRLTALFLLSCLCYGSLGAQVISGMVVDTTGQPVPFATVTLRKAQDSTLAKITACDTAGVYRFPSPPAGRYFLSVVAVGYTATRTAPFEWKDSTIVLAPIVARFHDALTTAQVTAVKPLLQIQR